MTTRSLCSGLDIQSEATQQMHFSRQDALVLSATASKPFRQYEIPLRLFFTASLACFLGYPSLRQPVSSVSLTTGPVVTELILYAVHSSPRRARFAAGPQSRIHRYRPAQQTRTYTPPYL
ncbi:hypothetical protein WMY93_030781 [Mugilogobius chulae]|uniref:Uncharacterized protein n=1 Tax=Mugilogobius chulae TaxID=88201 RepID=A0AAW0ML38_9GOBI